MAAFDFVVVAGDVDDFHAGGEFGGFGAGGVEVFDGEPLGGDGLFVFEAGVADVHIFAAEGVGEDVGGGHGGESAFFDFEVAVGADAFGFVGGDFLDAEVFEVLFDEAADAGEVFGEVDGFGERTHGVAPCAGVGEEKRVLHCRGLWVGERKRMSSGSPARWAWHTRAFGVWHGGV